MKNKLIITRHARDRMVEGDLDEDRLNKLWLCSRRIKQPITRLSYKLVRYGTTQNDVQYFWAGGYLMTVDMSSNVLITVTKKSFRGLKLV